jgi:hypothetical protein
MSLKRDEPVSLRGSISVPIKKKGPSTFSMADWRSILLKNYVIKHHHAFLRTRLYILMNASFHSSQSGGMRGKGTDMANASLRWTLHTLTKHGFNTCVFFVDILSAF